METIIVEIFVPAITQSFDFSLPSEGRIGDVTEEIIRILELTQQNLAIDKSLPMLCNVENGNVLNPEMRIAETGLHDSSKLILI